LTDDSSHTANDSDHIGGLAYTTNPIYIVFDTGSPTNMNGFIFTHGRQPRSAPGNWTILGTNTFSTSNRIGTSWTTLQSFNITDGWANGSTSGGYTGSYDMRQYEMTSTHNYRYYGVKVNDDADDLGGGTFTGTQMWFNMSQIDLFYVPPPPIPFVTGKVPNWLQPKSGQYTATMGGYESQFPAWCSPTSAANQLGHLVVHGGVTQPANINDGFDAGNDSPFALAASTIAWDSGYGWGDYMLDGPTYRGKNLFTSGGVVSDFGWHMNTNNLGPLGTGAGSAAGSTLQNIYNGMTDFYQQVGYTNMVGMVYHFNGSVQTFGQEPAYWAANGHIAAAGVSADWTITLNTIKHEIDNNRTVIACFNGWSITPTGHADLTGMTSNEDETGTYQTLGEFQPAGPHGEQFNIASTENGNVESYNAGLGHTVLIVGYIPAGATQDPTGTTEWLVVRDNFTTTHKNVLIPFADLSKLLATVYVNHTTATYSAITVGGTDYGNSASTNVTFSTNTLTIENSIDSTDTDIVSFVLPAGEEMADMSVTNFVGTGTITYTLATGGTTVTTGTFTATGTNLLSGSPLIASADTTYTLTLTADATITYTIVGTTPDVYFSNNILTIENSIDATDTDAVSFVLPVGDEMHQLVVTNCTVPGTITYTLATGGSTITDGTFTSPPGKNLLSDFPLVTGGSTYVLTLSTPSTTAITYTIIGTKVTDYGNTSPTSLAFSNNILTLDNVTSTTDTDVIDFVLPAGYNIPELNVTNFNGTGNVSYALTTGGNTIVSGSFSAISSNLLPSGISLFSISADTTYLLTITADALIGYSIVGTRGVTNVSDYSITTLLGGGYTEQNMIDAGKWDADSNANRFNSTYNEGFLDISGNVTVTGNILMDTGDIDLHSLTYTDPHVFTTDVPINNRLFVVGDVSMGDASLNIVGDMSLNGTMSVGTYKSGSISTAAAIIPTSGYSTSGTTTTFTEDIAYTKKIKFNGDISLNMLYGVDFNEPNVFVSTDAKTTTTGLSWQDIQMSSTGQYMVAVVGGNTFEINDATGNVWVSTDFGENWTEVMVGGDAQQWISAMVSGDGSVMMVKARGQVLYKSTDYGVNWTSMTITIPNETYADNNNYGSAAGGISSIWMKMAYDGLNLSTFYCNNPMAGGQQASNSYYTFIRSTDGGDNWAETTSTYGKINTFNTSRNGKYIVITYFDNSTKPKYSDDYGATFYTLTNGPINSMGASTYANAVCISNTGKICLELWAPTCIFHNFDVTTGTVSNGENDAVDTAVTMPENNTGGNRFTLNNSNDGKYIFYYGHNSWANPGNTVGYYSNDYGATFSSHTSASPLYQTYNYGGSTDRIWGAVFSDDNKYVAVVQEDYYIYIHNTSVFVPNPDSTTYFGANTTLKTNNTIEFSDSTTLQSSNKEADGTTFKASKFESMTVIGDFYSPAAVVTSDYRIKTNVETLDETHIVDNLRPVKYKQTQTGKNDIGFLAHELQEHYPELVEGEKDGDKMQSVNYSGLLPILINEVQQLKKQIAETRDRIRSENNE
jgi:hypothetical protein